MAQKEVANVKKSHMDERREAARAMDGREISDVGGHEGMSVTQQPWAYPAKKSTSQAVHAEQTRNKRVRPSSPYMLWVLITYTSRVKFRTKRS